MRRASESRRMPIAGGLSAAQREAVALAHGLAEVRAALVVHLKHLPQQPRLTRICENAIDRILPSDPRDVGDDNDE